MRSPNLWLTPGVTSSRAVVPVLSLRKETDSHAWRKNRSRSRRAAASIPQPTQRCERHSCKNRLQAGNSRPEHFGDIRRDNSLHVPRAISHRPRSTTARSRRAPRRDRRSLHKMAEALSLPPITHVNPGSNKYAVISTTLPKEGTANHTYF